MVHASAGRTLRATGFWEAFRAGRREEAIRDADWLLLNRPEGVNLNQVDELRRLLERPEK